MYGVRDIEAAKLRQTELARSRERVPLGENGVCTMRIDPVAYHNAVQLNRKQYGVRDIWTEKEFRDDMARRHPELATVTKGKRPMIGGCGFETAPNRLTRFGRATYSKVY